jgi:hypothetical protein
MASSLASTGVPIKRLNDRKFVASQARDQLVVATALAQARRDSPQQLVAERMSERIVDALEVIEIEAEDGEILPGPPDPPERLIQPLMKENTVGKAGQCIVMRHMGDPRLGLLAFGHVDDGDEDGFCPIDDELSGVGQHLDLAAVGLDVPPGAAGEISVIDRAGRFQVHVPLIARPDVGKAHGLKGGAIVSVVRDGSVVDTDERQADQIVEPHRNRVAVEQQPERCLALFERADVRQRGGQEIADGRYSDAEMDLASADARRDLELVLAAGLQGGEQAAKNVRRLQRSVHVGEAPPEQVVLRSAEEARRGGVQRHDLEIDHAALAIAQRGQRQHPVVG